MKKALAFSYLALGITSVVAQVLLIRELLIAFVGNEFFIGWTLFAWLFWTGLGARAGGRFGARAGTSHRPLVVCHACAAALLPALLVAVRCGRTLLGTVPGAAPDLGPAAAFAFVGLAPLGLALGAQFALGLRPWRAGPNAERAPGRAYALETLGFAVGGGLFAAWFAVANEFRVVGWLGGLNVLAGFALCAGFRDRSAAFRLVLLLALAAVAPAWREAARLERWTDARRFPGQFLVETRRSIYGHLAVAATGRQLAYFENGLLLGAEDEPQASETFAHFSLLAHPAPKRILLIGNGFNGVLGEILKHAPERVDYVELDPELIALARKYAAPARRAALDDPRVHVECGDGRRFLARRAANPAAAPYDAVLVNLPAPGTVLLNRFYTREFFRAARRQLAPGGLLAVRLPFSPDYLGPELENLGAALERTLRAEFATTTILPDYDVLYLASAVAPPAAPEEWIARSAARGLRNDFAVPPAIAERLTTDRIGQVRAAFAANRTAQINRDERPIACAYVGAYWLRAYHPGAAAFATRLAEARWPWGAAGAALAAAGMAWATRGRRTRRIGPWALGIASFSLMALEMILLLAFQSFCGYLYHWLALILAALMLGMAAGTALGARANRRGLVVLHGLLALLSVALAYFLHALAAQDAWATASGVEWIFLAWAALAGGVVGAEFPAANRVYAAEASDAAEAAGVVYAADLAGSCLGALWISLWSLPVLGAGPTLAILAGLNVAAAFIAGCQINED